MTPEAKAAVMQLMGQTYGQMKKQDAMLIGQSGNLKPKSGEMKGLVEQLVAAPTAPSQQQHGAPPQQGPPPQQAPQQAPPQPQAAPAPAGPPAPITPEQAMAELQQAPATPPLEVNAFAPVPEEQLGFDFSEPNQMDQLLEAVKESNLLLKEIKLQLENTNVRPKRKSAKSKIAQ